MTYQTLATFTAYIADIAPTLNDIYAMYATDPIGCHSAAASYGHPHNRSWLMEYVDHYATGAAHIVVAPEHVDAFAALVSQRVEELIDTFDGDTDEFHSLFSIVVAIAASAPKYKTPPSPEVANVR